VARVDRRQKLALNEAYQYYLSLDKNHILPELYELVKCLKTVNAALAISNGHFKLTVQLWRRIQQALFDRLITTFPGYVTVMDVQGQQLKPGSRLPSDGVVEFHPDRCRRRDDIFALQVKNLYPATEHHLMKAWQEKKQQRLSADDFPSTECGPDGCFLKPVVLGTEVLDAESQKGRDEAYRNWWDLYWQAYCTGNRHEKVIIYKRMDQLEAVWGSLYY